MKQVTTNNNNTILKSFRIEDEDTLQKAQHQKHKYLEIKNGKYIYDYDKMSVDDHKQAEKEHHRKYLQLKEKHGYEWQSNRTGAKSLEEIKADEHRKESRKHEDLAEQKIAKEKEGKKKEMSEFTTDEEDEKMSAEEHLERAEHHKKEKIKNVGGDHLYEKYLEHSNAEKAHRKMAEERKKK